METIDEFVESMLALLVVLVAAGHFEQVLGELGRLWPVGPLVDALVHLDSLLLLETIRCQYMFPILFDKVSLRSTCRVVSESVFRSDSALLVQIQSLT